MINEWKPWNLKPKFGETSRKHKITSKSRKKVGTEIAKLKPNLWQGSNDLLVALLVVQKVLRF